MSYLKGTRLHYCAAQEQLFWKASVSGKHPKGLTIVLGPPTVAAFRDGFYLFIDTTPVLEHLPSILVVFSNPCFLSRFSLSPVILWVSWP